MATPATEEDKVVPIKAPAKRAPRKATAKEAVTVSEDMAAKDARITELEKEVAEWTKRWDKAWKEMSKAADARGLCSEYDDVVRRVGGIPRYQEISVTMSTKMRTRLTKEFVMGAMGLNVRYSAADFTLGSTQLEWELRISRTIRARSGECACEQVNADTYLASELRRAGIGAHTTVVSTTKSCPNDGRKAT